MRESMWGKDIPSRQNKDKDDIDLSCRDIAEGQNRVDKGVPEDGLQERAAKGLIR